MQIQRVLENCNIFTINSGLIVMQYTFSKTSKSFESFRSFLNHVRAYCKQNNANVETVLYVEYCDQFGKTECKHCGEETEYQGYAKGFKDRCYTPDCYESFVKNNLERYENCARSTPYVDPYDDKSYNSFTKTFFYRTGKLSTDIQEFSTRENCTICGSKFFLHFSEARKQTCSDKCKHEQIGKTRTIRTNACSSIETLPHTIEYLNRYLHDHGCYPDNETYIRTRTKILLKTQVLLRQHGDTNVIEYFSNDYNVWFYKTSVSNTLKAFLKSRGIEYDQYHLDNNLGVIENCEACKKKILVEDVFGCRTPGTGRFCAFDCYNSFAKAGLHKERKNAHTETRRKSMSETMKKKIKDGEFTPHVHNSRTQLLALATVNGKTKAFRSTWEAAYQAINPTFEYETVRIPYEFDGNVHTYIVDFVDRVSKQLVEIKPYCHVDAPKHVAKKKAAQAYCEKVGYTFVEITEKDFLQLLENRSIISLLEQTLSDQTLKKFLKGIKYESSESKIHQENF